MGTHKDLEVWQKSLDLADLTYESTKHFPSDERFGLTNQMRRCAVSVSSNIAEGCGRNNTKELIHFIGVARGSLAELETQCFIANRRSFMDMTQFADMTALIESVSKMLFRLQESLKVKTSTT